MAAITTVALSAAAAGYQVYQGQQQKKKAQKALNDYDRQDLDNSNPYENMPISTVGSDLLREENQRSNANAVDALRNGGARGISMIPQVVANNNTQNRETRAYLDDKITKRDYAIAGDQAAIRGMKEDRENGDLAGLGQQLQVGRQDMWSGFRGLANAGMYAANNVDWSAAPREELSGLDSSLQPAGLKPFANNDFRLPNYSNVIKNYNKT